MQRRDQDDFGLGGDEVVGIQIGDRVKYVGRYIPYYGRTGIVEDVYNHIAQMRDDSGDPWHAYMRYLENVPDDTTSPTPTEMSDIDDFLSEY